MFHTKPKNFHLNPARFLAVVGLIFCGSLASSCSQSSFTSNTPKPQVAPQKPVEASAPVEAEKEVVESPEITVDEGVVISVPITKVHIRVNVDHVTDFVVSDTEIYAIHHELGEPSFAVAEFFGPDGNMIDTQNWTISFPGCPQRPRSDANCKSTKITL